MILNTSFSFTFTTTTSREYILSDKKEDTSAQDVQAELSEIERDLTLRRLLWESAEEWDRLEAEWTSSSFDKLNVEILQKNVNRFTQTVYMLEKGECTSGMFVRHFSVNSRSLSAQLANLF
jgi:hypothetical protein